MGLFDDILNFAKEYAPYIAAGATVAGAAIPFFASSDAPSVPAYEPSTASQIQSEANQEALKKRREIARRRGTKSTIRTPLGVSADLGIKRTDITGV